MAQPNRKRIEDIFQQAVDQPPSGRVAALHKACGEDSALRAAVEKLLRIHDRGLPDSMHTPLFTTMESSATIEVPQPARIGRYQVLRKLGEGGMGIVYEARQENPSRTVALKVIRTPAFGSLPTALLHRFQHEAEILGQLQHPGIAQIYEAGIAEIDYGAQPVAARSSGEGVPPSAPSLPATADVPRAAVPFFAMEFVRGSPLREFADTHSLGTRERLELMAKICDAVQYAHHKGVIHRDLKPANILVVCDDEGTKGSRDRGIEGMRAPGRLPSVPASAQPKILDFGVARTTNADLQTVTLRTDMGQLIGTIPYMSPEQVTGDSRQLDPRSDVYALGAVLYELLSGRLPHDVRHHPIPEAVRIIREEEPSRLSSISPLFRGDIETIVSKALEKDKARRYAAAAEFAKDIRRYLRDEPIVARPASALYQLGKFARRNRGVVIAACLIFVLLVAAIVITSALFLRAEHHRGVAVESAGAAQRQAYQASIAAAQAGLAGHDLALARRALDGAPNVLRGWEWRYLDWWATRGGGIIDRLDVRLRSGGVSRASPYVALACTDGSISLWDIEKAESRRVIKPPGAGVSCLAISPDGERVVAKLEGESRTMVLWDAGGGRELWRREKACSIGPGAFSPDGTRLVAAFSDGAVHVMDAETGVDRSVIPLTRRPEGGCTASPDGRQILVAVDGYVVQCIDSDSGAVLWETPGRWAGFGEGGRRVWWCDAGKAGLVSADDGRVLASFEGVNTSISQADLSLDGQCLTTRERGGALVIRDGRSASVVCTLETRDPNAAVYYADRDRRLVAFGADAIQVWDAAVSASPFAFRTQSLAAHFTRDGRRALDVGWGVLRLLDLQRGAYVWNRALSRKLVRSAAFNPDESLLIALEETGKLHVLDARTGETSSGPWMISGVPFCAVWAAQGVIVVCEDGTVRAVDPTTGVVRAVLLGEAPAPTCLAVDDGGRTLACGTSDGGVTLWSLPDGSVRSRLGSLPGPVTCVAFDSTGSRLAAGSRDGAVRIWESGALRQRLSTDGKPVNVVAFHPDGTRLAAIVSEDAIHIWDTVAGDRMVVLRNPGQRLRSLAFSSDGGTLLTSSANEIVLFETAPPACGFAEREHYRRARALFEPFSPRTWSRDIVTKLRADPSLAAELLETAVAQVEARGDSPNDLNSQAWGLVRFSGRAAGEYGDGLRLSEAACALWPDEWSMLNTLGVAQYRIGDYTGALATFERGARLRADDGLDTHPADATFIAMAHQRLGHEGQARDNLDLAARLMLESPYSSDEELRAFSREAEGLIGGDR